MTTNKKIVEKAQEKALERAQEMKKNNEQTNMAVDDELFEGDFENMQIRAEADVARKENINLKHQIEKLQRQLSNLTKPAASSSSPSPQPRSYIQVWKRSQYLVVGVVVLTSEN
ncbi:fad dependent oxidoreductase [Lasius niger]|uniref:Fad dependent oxidoreductase n=1 Tax=Lasius niger TaxID=67767 RepID=A0A0J7JZ76_LASNI|nr:fad dependent oxidoreductase [Lasius niger]